MAETEGRYLGVDYGTRRVGLAVADPATRLAAPVDTVAPDEVAGWIAERGPFRRIVVGLPRSLAGTDTPQTAAARAFADTVLRPLGAPLIFQDEAGTSSVAEDRLREANRPYDKARIDSESAAIILQDYLDSAGTATAARIADPDSGPEFGPAAGSADEDAAR